ncbi:phage tail protein, partial [Neisseria sp. S1]
MANLTETARWEAGIYQFETSDPVMGGPNGIDNRPTRELANRTLWLKTELAKAVASIGQNKTAADQGLATKADKTVRIIAGNGLTGGNTLEQNITVALGLPGKITASTTNSV